MRKLISVVGLYLLTVASVVAQTKTIKPTEAKDHIGERTTVCGKVVSAHFANKNEGEPTFLNLDEPYPKQVFTVVIWGTNREKFGAPEVKLQGTRVCVTGKIVSYRNEPEMTATDPDQIMVQK